MAYGSYMYFDFTSINGNVYRIDIKRKNYTGTSMEGVLGGSPVLRRDKNDAVMGTSLEFPVESQTEGDLLQFYTSDPSEFEVELTRNQGDLIFVGHLEPELYSEPDIAPPYDVTFTAVDGLGELKRSKFYGGPDDTIDTIFRGILRNTNLDLPVYYASSLGCYDINPATGMHVKNVFDELHLDLRFLDGKKNYDVLQKLLATFNARIFQQGRGWVIFCSHAKESHDHGMYEAYNAKGTSYTIVPVAGFGSMDRFDRWPVGTMSKSIIPASNKVTVSAPDNYRPGFLEPGAVWILQSASFAQYKNDEYCIAMSSRDSVAWQEVTVQRSYRLPLDLEIEAIYSKDPDIGRSGKIYFKVEVTTWSENGQKSYVYSKTNGEDTQDGYFFPDIQPPSGFSDVIFFLDEPADTKKPKKLTLKLPPHPVGVKRINVKLTNLSVADGRAFPLIVKANVGPNESKGFKLIGNINNGAREELKEVESLVPYNDAPYPYTATKYRTCDSDALYGVPFASKVNNWTDRVNACKEFYLGDAYEYGLAQFDDILLRELARENGLPRVKMDGTLNEPFEDAPSPGIPFIMYDAQGLNYIVDRATWGLYDDEVDVEMTSMPTGQVEIANVKEIVIED